MSVKNLPIPGVLQIPLEQLDDERGFFVRTFCQETLRQHGIADPFVQCNRVFNRQQGTIRGLHYQQAPYEESKIVHCLRGKVFDVLLDLRSNSPTYGQVQTRILDAKKPDLLYVPKGCAHGYQTLEDDTELFYHMSAAYVPTANTGVHWQSPELNIEWPRPVTVVSEKDQRFPVFAKK